MIRTASAPVAISRSSSRAPAGRPGTRRRPRGRALAAGLLALVGALACGEGRSEGDAPGAAVEGGAADATVSSETIRAHMSTLSADSFAGRAPGTEGGDMAARYIAEQLQAAGLEPVQGSYFQPVPMVGNTPLPETARMVIEAGGTTFRPDYLDDYVLTAGDAEARSSEARGELVFVGYGIDAPETGWNDFEGMDVAGKVLLVLVNDPPAPPEEPDLFGGRTMTYYGRWTYKYEEAARKGAAGAFVIHTTEEAGYPWSVVRGGWSGEQFALPADPDAAPPAPVLGWFTHDLAREVLAAAGHDLDALVESAGSRDFRPVPTGVQVDAGIRSELRTVETANVVGLVPGSERPDEVVIVTSHYDHLGVGEPVDGDSIYNGAYDNASGTALLLALAEAFADLPEAPARSLLFVATAAEEQGLLGAEWYVQAPLFPLHRTVAEINVDGANLWGETDDLIAMGAERSELGPFVERRASEMGIRLAPDAEPEKGYFFRSDHFPFAKAGVPALYIEHGRDYRGRPEGWGDSILADYTANRYHAPGDEYSDDFVLDGATQQARLVFLTALDIAESDGFPNWNQGSEFRAARDRTLSEAGAGG